MNRAAPAARPRADGTPSSSQPTEGPHEREEQPLIDGPRRATASPLEALLYVPALWRMPSRTKDLDMGRDMAASSVGWEIEINLQYQYESTLRELEKEAADPEMSRKTEARIAEYDRALKVTQGRDSDSSSGDFDKARQIVHARARLLWKMKHGEEKCPTTALPSLKELDGWLLSDCPEEAKDVAKGILEKVYALDSGNIAYWEMTDPRPNEGTALVVVVQKEPLRMAMDRNNALFLYSRVESFEEVDAHWQALGTDDLPHPADPLIAAWLSRVVSIEADSRPNGVLPGSPAVRDVRMTDNPLEVTETGRIIEFVQAPSRLIPTPMIGFWSEVDGGTSSTGGSALIEWRLFNEVLMSVSPGRNRTYEVVSLCMTVRELACRIWPPKNPNSMSPGWQSRREGWPLLMRALGGLNKTAIQVGPDEAWLPVLTRRFPPSGDMDGMVIFEVRWPPNSRQGGLVHRPTLRRLGVRSSRLYRTYLGLCWLWDRHLTSHGWMWGATQRVVERHGPTGAVLVDEKPLEERRKLVFRASHPKAIPVLDEKGGETLERHRLADRCPSMGVRDRILLTHGCIDESNGNQRGRADQDLFELERYDICVVEQATHADWRIFPVPSHVNIHNALTAERLRRQRRQRHK